MPLVDLPLQTEHSLSRLSARSPMIKTATMILDPLTDTLLLGVRRIGSWRNQDRLRARLVVDVDGLQYVATAKFSGGLRRNLDRIVYPNSLLRWTLPWGFFGAHRTRRLAEGAILAVMWAELEWLGGNGFSPEVFLRATHRQAPNLSLHNSVAFDAATDVQEIAGDGVVSLTHTAGGSNRAAFAGCGWNDESPSASTSVTYGGTGMTEQWDVIFQAFFGVAGYSLANPATGAQTVTHTLAGVPNEHAFGVISMTGVDQTTPVGTPVTNSGGAVTSLSATVGSIGSDDLVVDVIQVHIPSGDASTWVVGADQTERFVELMSTNQRKVGGSTQPGTAGGVMSWSGNSATSVGMGAVAFKPAAAGGEPAVTHQVQMTAAP